MKGVHRLVFRAWVLAALWFGRREFGTLRAVERAIATAKEGGESTRL